MIKVHLTTWLLSLSICSKDTSRSAVDGTPSSSICGITGHSSITCGMVGVL